MDNTSTSLITGMVTVALLVFSFGQGFAADQQLNLSPGTRQAQYMSGEILVKYKENTTAFTRTMVTTSLRNEKIKDLDKSGLVHHIRLEANQSVEEVVTAYQSDPNVEFAQPNYIYRLQAVPNDARYGELWGLRNIGQFVSEPSYPINNPGAAGRDIDAELAWDQITDCRAIVVAVIDTGVNYTHTDLVANMWNGGSRFPHHGWDFQDDDNNPMPADASGHGTHVAGTIGAVGNNAIGTTGVCWNVQLMAVRAGGANRFPTSNIIRAIEFAADNGARIINMSLGGEGPFDRLYSDAINYARDRNVLIVVAAGNGGDDGRGDDNDGGGDDGSISTQYYPCNFRQDNLVCVAALDQGYQRARFSNYGVRSVDVGAPGTNIWSPWPGPPPQTDNFDGYQGNATGSSNWSAVTCDGIRALVNPSDFCVGGSYANNTDDRTWKQYNLGGLLGAGIRFIAEVDLRQGDLARVSFNRNGGDPFGGGTVLLPEIFGPISIRAQSEIYDLSGCLTPTCVFGFQLVSDSADAGRGVAIYNLELNAAVSNSRHYKNIGGTSMAAPHVAGLAAMAWAFNPNFTYQNVINSINNGGESLHSLSEITTTGKAVNAIGSLRYVHPPTGVTALVQ